ncbi:MAG: plasmid pRiA4b ORF-3 family protein [Clostridiales bacterium]|nr:plasmid pRiA4b ORF-3 family protein [Clostridiales bacterium]
MFKCKFFTQICAKKERNYSSWQKQKNAISRDILVPGEMNLHALHYAIQRLFGWQNSHLHNFSLPQADFDQFTADTFGGYTDLCGVLFRFPDSDASDTNWDDDYKKRVSVKT